ncbi:NRDE family protein [Piscinibacter sp.]|uniref:NRDE family protein n=1 Tax=Piscinibacter sp. TaxID=1903157 RepID=UPI002F3F8C44
MCLVALAIDQDRRFPLVVAANRDEFFKRATARLAWWTPESGGPAILGGRDLEAGGTWIGLTAEGRLAFVTNVRNPQRNDPNAPSRGRIVPDWLAARESTDRFWMRTALSGYNGFNLVAADFRRGECFWASSTGVHPVRLERGVHGLSNAGLDTPWPKVAALKSRMSDAIASAESVDALSLQLFDALADDTRAPDEALPDTGVPLEWERTLSAAFIRTPDMSYGTRCSTLIIAERVNRHLVTHVLERTFSASGGVALMRRSTLKNWPPRYSEETAPSEQGPVSESELGTGAEAPKRVRVRSLLKPDPLKRRRPTAASA